MRKTTLLLALILAVVPAACGDDSTEDTTATTAADTGTGTGDAATDTSDADTGTTVVGEDSFKVEGSASVTDAVDVEVDDNYFKPNVLTAKPGSKITLNLSVEGSNPHNISVEGQSVDHDLGNGDTFAAEVTVPASGNVVFFCKIHRGSGMVGVVEVG